MRSNLDVIDPSLRHRPLYGQAPTFAAGDRAIIDLLACDYQGSPRHYRAQSLGRFAATSSGAGLLVACEVASGPWGIQRQGLFPGYRAASRASPIAAGSPGVGVSSDQREYSALSFPGDLRGANWGKYGVAKRNEGDVSGMWVGSSCQRHALVGQTMVFVVAWTPENLRGPRMDTDELDFASWRWNATLTNFLQTPHTWQKASS